MLVVSMALLLAPAVSGQDAAAYRDSAIRLTTSMSALRDSLFDRDSLVVEVARRGGLVFSASPRQRGAAASKVFAQFMADRSKWFGAAAPSPSGFRIVIRILGAAEGAGRFGAGSAQEGQVVLTGLPDTGASVRREGSARAAELGDALLQSYAEMMFRKLGDRMQQWLVDPPPLTMDEHERRYLAMYAVMTSAGKAERGCLNGRIDYCALALGLRPAPTPDLTGSYSQLVRFDFFLTALGVGGEETWSRLAEAGPARAEDALSAATHLPVDSLLSVWRNQIVGLKPEESPLRAGGVLIAAAWTAGLLLGTLAVSRWR
jgi:hypothetical protein